ncbi:Aldo/keto reductase [Xylariaceae sp. FL0255]|nr:Aldo/keto reductase [Xylariaceae sp. FL0255]
MTITSTRRPLHEVIPPLVLGTATFNTQYVENPYDLPAASIISRALDLGVTAFDTSPYYGPSEQILGAALSHPSVTSRHARSSYFLVTKVGRVASDEFNYSAPWIRESVHRSLERLGKTEYLDLVYAHDVEFVSPAEVLTVVRELRRLRDEEGVVRYVGISGYPVEKLCELAELVLRETGEPLDAVLSYSHFHIQNTTLGKKAVSRFTAAGVDVVLNASMLGMGLLTTRGADSGTFASWHPSPEGLRAACQDLVPVAVGAGEKLEVVAIRWALDNWSRDGVVRGTSFLNGAWRVEEKEDPSSTATEPARIGVSVMGISSIPELEETARVFNSVIEGMGVVTISDTSDTPTEGAEADNSAKVARRRTWSLERRDKIQRIVEDMWAVLGEWKDYSWSSPDPGFVNKADALSKMRQDGNEENGKGDGYVIEIPEKESAMKVNVEEIPLVKAAI